MCRNLNISTAARSIAVVGGVLLPWFGSIAAASADKEIARDPVTGMIMTGDWELVRNTCIVCHSPRTFLQQGATFNTWREVVQWMQRDAGLETLAPEIESKILTYLAENYGPGDAYRRAPIPPTLMPVNPYRREAEK